MTDRIYTYKDFVQAHLKSEKHQNHHPDLAKYYGGLYEHLSQFFQVDLRIESDREFAPDGFGLGALFRAAVAYYNQIATPFDTFITVTPAMHQVIHTYSSQFETLARTSRDTCFEMLCDLYRRLYGETAQVITSAVLRDQGFDDSQEPDEKMYV